MTLQELMDELEKGWAFDEKNYSRLKDIPQSDRMKFAVEHISKHLATILGQLAQVQERWDHGRAWPWHEVNEATVNLNKCALRLAIVLGIDANDLMHRCQPKGKKE